jgi:hypothetical protein
MQGIYENVYDNQNLSGKINKKFYKKILIFQI